MFSSAHSLELRLSRLPAPSLHPGLRRPLWGNSCSTPWTKAPAKPPSPAPAGHPRLRLSPRAASAPEPPLPLPPSLPAARWGGEDTTANDAPCRGGTNAAVGTRRGASGARRRHLFHLAAGSDRFCGLPAPPPFPGRLRRGCGCSSHPWGARQGTAPTSCPPPALATGTYGRRLPECTERSPPGAERLWLAALSWSLPDPSPPPNRCFPSLPFFPVAFSLFNKRYCIRGALSAGLLHLPRDRQGKRAALRRADPALPEPRVPAPFPAPFLPPVPSSSACPPAEPPRLRRHHPAAEVGRAVPRSPARASFAGHGAPSPESCPRDGGVTAASGAAGASGQGKPGPRLPPARWAAMPGPPSVIGRSRESSGLRRGFPAERAGEEVRGGGRRRTAVGTFRRAGGRLLPAPAAARRPAPRTRSQVGRPRGSAGLGWAAEEEGGRELRCRRGGGSRAGLRHRPRSPARARALRAGGRGRAGGGSRGRSGRGTALTEALLPSRGRARCTRSPCRDLGGGRCPGIDQPAAGRRGLSCPDALALQGFAGAPFRLLIPASPFPPLLVPRSAPLPAVCLPVRGAEGGEAGAEPGAAAALAAFDVSFECRRLARSWLPPYAVLGAGRRPLKGHCRQRRAWRGARSRLRVPPAAAAAEPPPLPGHGAAPGPAGAAPHRRRRSCIFAKSACLHRRCAIPVCLPWAERKVFCFHAIHFMRWFATPRFSALNESPCCRVEKIMNV